MILSKISSMFDKRKKLIDSLNLLTFFLTFQFFYGLVFFILLVFKMSQDIPYRKDRLMRASLFDIKSFLKHFRILVGILFGYTAL